MKTLQRTKEKNQSRRGTVLPFFVWSFAFASPFCGLSLHGGK